MAAKKPLQLLCKLCSAQNFGKLRPDPIHRLLLCLELVIEGVHGTLLSLSQSKVVDSCPFICLGNVVQLRQVHCNFLGVVELQELEEQEVGSL